MLVPVLGPQGQTQSLQTISPNGEKRFLRGGKMSGGLFIVRGKDHGPLLICEGLATALSLHEATGATVLVAFNCGNLKAVAGMARKNYPERQITICGDDDHATQGNPGQENARAAAIAVGGKFVLPEFGEKGGWTDFNDLHQTEGLEAVRAQVEAPADPGEEEESVPEHVLAPLPPLPLDVFPKTIAEVIRVAARAYCVPVEVPALAILALSSACIGRTRALLAKTSWTEHPNLFLAMVARSGLGKSPCTNSIFRAVYRCENRWHKEWLEEAMKYQEEVEVWRSAKGKKREEMGAPPQKPERRQLVVDDATIESIADGLATNPRGLLWLRDELSGLLADLDKYANDKGGTRARLLSSYDSKPWKVNRISGRDTYIRHATLGIFGTMQPGLLKELFTSSDRISGFLPRFLFVLVYPEGPVQWTDEAFGEPYRTQVDDLTEALLKLDFDKEGDPDAPVCIDMSSGAKACYKEWFNELGLDQWTGGEENESICAKLRGQALRIALILHHLDWFANEAEETGPVSPKTMSNALKLTDWFKAHQLQVWRMIDDGRGVRKTEPRDLQVARAILQSKEKIKSGFLPTALITEEVNKGVDAKMALKPEQVGRLCKELGLRPKRATGGIRGYEIGEKALAHLEAMLNPGKSVPNVHTVTDGTKTDSCSVTDPVTDAATALAISSLVGDGPKAVTGAVTVSNDSNQRTNVTSDAGDGFGCGSIEEDDHPGWAGDDEALL